MTIFQHNVGSVTDGFGKSVDYLVSMGFVRFALSSENGGVPDLRLVIDGSVT